MAETLYPLVSDLAADRQRMVEVQLSGRGVRDRLVLDAMREVPREQFVDPGFEEFAYEDSPLPIGAGQTISQPYIVALMLQAGEIKPGARVLEVGAGSGYAAAVASRIAARVYAIERHASLAHGARRRLERLGYRNVEIRAGDGTRGWPEAAPCDAILVAAGGPSVPAALKEQLALGGRLVIPVGEESRSQRFLKLRRTDANTFEEEQLGGVRFVPLVGEQG
jgi:protein-L-isoaspartate(D-aspartate) O-methyltransferase